MKLCYACKRLTSGDAVYCQNCGRTYNVKLCSRQHVNPRSAEFCSQCGSRDLSNPQPKVPLLVKPFLWILRLLPGFVLVGAGVAFVVVFIRQLFANPNGLLPLMCIGLLFGLLLLAWMFLPGFVKRLLAKPFKRRVRN